MSDILLWIITLALFAIGLAGIFIPALPGIGLLFTGVLVYAWATGFSSISAATVVTMGFLTLAALAADYAGSVLGARIGGGKRWAIIGTFAGAVAGLVAGGPLALLIGSFIGAFIGALLEGQRAGAAGRVATSAVVGILGATAVQFVLGLVMIAGFFIALAA